MKSATGFAATAALFVSSASALSTFAVVNHCDFDLYLWSVEGNQPPSQMFTLPANTPHIGYSETYRYAGQYEGVSIKIAPYYQGDGQVPTYSLNVTQLEYTVPPPENNDPSIYYDLSMVNGNAFMGIPFSYSPSNPGAVPQCVAGACSGNYETCTAGYNGAHDDWNTHACPKEQDIIFTFCNGNAQQPLIVPTGKVTTSQFSKLSCYGGSCLKKREAEAEPEPEPEAEADPLAVCFSAAAAKAGDGVPIVAGLCPNAEPTTSSSAAPAPTPTSTSKPAPPASTPSAVAALQQPAAQPSSSTTSSSSSSAAPVATHSAAPAPAPAPPATAPSSPLSALQLSSLANTGVTCWQSVITGQTCGVSARSLPEKRDTHAHSHRHNHMAFHRRNRIIKSAA